jgi:glycyl-tRNA synthetase (class II)
MTANRVRRDTAPIILSRITLPTSGRKVVNRGWSNEQMENFIREKGIKCPVCGNARIHRSKENSHLMFKTFQGVTRIRQTPFICVRKQLREYSSI